MCVSVRSFSIGLPIAFRNNFARAFVGDAGGHMDIKTKYGWQELYATALLETNWSTIDEKIQVAEKGIGVSFKKFSRTKAGSPEEIKAFKKLWKGLTVLRK